MNQMLCSKITTVYKFIAIHKKKKKKKIYYTFCGPTTFNYRKKKSVYMSWQFHETKKKELKKEKQCFTRSDYKNLF